MNDYDEYCQMQSHRSEHASRRLAANNVPQDSPPLREAPIPCASCGGQLWVKAGKNGKFYGCENFPSCKNTRSL